MQSTPRIAVVLALGWATVCAARAPQTASPRAERLRFDSTQDKWVDLPKLEPGTAEGDLALARAQFAARKYKKTSQSIKAWEKAYGSDSELYPEVLLLRARTEKASRNYHKAYGLCKRIIEEYPGTEPATDAAGEAFNVAEVFLSGVRRKLWGMRLLKADQLAINILDDIVTRFPDSSLAERAVKTVADHYYQQGDFGLAEMEYTRLTQLFPRSRYRRYAMRRSAEAALANFAGVHFDDAPLIEAEERYRLYAAQYREAAAHENVGLVLDNIREKRGGKEFAIGAYYERADHPRAAAFYYRSTANLWPDTIAAARAQAALARLGDDVASPTEADPDTDSLETE